MRNQKGFTIIELVAVLVVLGIIVGFAVARMGSVSDEYKAQGINRLVDVLNSHEALTWGDALLHPQVMGTFQDANAHRTLTYDAAGTGAYIKGDYSLPVGQTWPADSATAAVPFDVVFQNYTGQIARVCPDLAEQCQWQVQ